MKKEILLLGDKRLYETSTPVLPEKWPMLESLANDLHDTLLAFREKYGAGRAIAAPQIGVAKRVVYQYIDGVRTVYVNPALSFPDNEVFEVLDDCMSFPGLYVRVQRHKRCRVDYTDINGQPQSIQLEGGLAELIQHEYDHLDGILATMRAVDNKAFVLKQ